MIWSIIIIRDSLYDYRITNSLHSRALTPNKLQVGNHFKGRSQECEIENDEMKRIREREYIRGISLSLILSRCQT